ncbi:MAG: nitroreductase family protein [Bacteroidales bacterium]|jgi:nitroreductase|nr:nitroreductase family protein [Bacteroidales bacterium]
MDDKSSIVLETIQNRKSVRNYTREPVSRDCLLALLKAGMAAPSANNQQRWVFIAVTERKTMDLLAENLPYAKMLFTAGAAIVVCGNTIKPMAEGSIDLWWEDAGACTENILLAAEAMGLGAVWTAVYPYPERETQVRKTLHLPAGIIPFSLVPIGYPTGKDKPKEKFRAEKIHWETW